MAKRGVRTTAKAVIRQEGRVLTVVHGKGADRWYSLPGGGQNRGETLPQALRRECVEEIGCDVVVGSLLFVRDYIARNHEFADQNRKFHKLDLFFECTLPAGSEPGLGTHPDSSQTGVAWLPLARLDEYAIYPKILRRTLTNGAPADPYLGDVN